MKIWKLIALLTLLSISVLDAQPLDDIVERRIMKERKVLRYSPMREADIFWERRVWRVLDVREKMNLPFIYPRAPFFDLLVELANQGKIQAYSSEDDRFSLPLTPEQLEKTLYSIDTIPIPDPNTFEIELKIVKTGIYYEDIKRFRIKELWYFDEARSSLQVRILGIAPLKEVYGENGNFRYEQPLFWVYYPSLREHLAREKLYMTANDASLMSWEDLFEMRFFASSIYKSSNVLDYRIQDNYQGIEALLEADKLKEEIRQFEHDLWSY